MIGTSDELQFADTAVSEIAEAASPSEVFSALLRGAQRCAPRAAVLLARRGVFRGWAGHGLASRDAARLRSFEATQADHWPLWPARAPFRGVASIRTDDPPFLADHGEEAAAAVTVGDRVAAIVVIGRGEAESPWHPVLLGLLARVAALRLELDLERRRAVRPSEPAAAEPRAAVPERGLAAVDTAPPIDPSTAEPRPDLASARRFARLVATDIRLYNEEAIVLGRRHGDLAERLRESLDRGQETFDRKFPALGNDGRRVLHEAYVQVLAGGDEELLPG